jgi:membrane associated rhomboid family serine protease
MRSPGYQRFVAVFVGVLLVLAAVMAAVTGDESMIGTTVAVGGFYAVYMVLFLRKEKERRKQKSKKADSPLLRR